MQEQVAGGESLVRFYDNVGPRQIKATSPSRIFAVIIIAITCTQPITPRKRYSSTKPQYAGAEK